MKRTFRLIVFAILVTLFLGEAIGLSMFYLRCLTEQKKRDMQEVQEAKLAVTIVSFHSYYNQWPCPVGILSNDADVELEGFDAAKINTQHINFYEKNNCPSFLLDRWGNAFYFKVDDSIGTCSVYSKVKSTSQP